MFDHWQINVTIDCIAILALALLALYLGGF